MNATLLILFLFLVSFPASQSSGTDFVVTDNFAQIKCPEEKSKTNLCAFAHQEGNALQFLVFDNCDKGKKCVVDGTCAPKLKLRKLGESCNYNEDCMTKLC